MTVQSRSVRRALVYVMVALVAWMFFANSTGISVAYYYPYEVNILALVLLFTGALAAQVSREVVYE